MEQYETLKYTHDGQIGVLTLNRPQARNAINETMIRELGKALARIEADVNLRALILTGAGNNFSAGGDISMIDQGLEHPYEFFRLHDLLTKVGTGLEQLGIPVIAAIKGIAYGGGLELALACDMRIMAATAKLALPEAGLGVIPGAGGTARLARILGREQAFLMMMVAEPIGADEALGIGLTAQVTAQEKVMDAAYRLARKICTKAPLAIATIKKSVILSENMPLDGATDYCQQAALLLGTSQDAREGMQAFLEKRLPKWKGK